MKILIGGGGTAGHLVPGIALYQELKNNGCDILYILSNRDKAYDISHKISDSDKIFVTLTGISRKLSFNTIKQIWSIFKAWRDSFQIIKAYNPEFIVITGGYVSNIAALSALVLRKRIYILEQNSVAGITNRVWSLFADKIFTTFPNPKYIPIKKEIWTGNPLLYTSLLSVEESKEILGLRVNDKPVLGISGGSQGAQKINDIVLKIFPKLIEKGYQIIWSLGTKEFDRLEQNHQLSIFNSYSDDIKAVRFITRMDAFWGASSLVLARSGAGTVSEAMLFKTPCLFIPIYNSPDNHQFLNAEYLRKQNCASILEENILSEEVLFERICLLMENLQQFHHFSDTKQNPVKEISTYLL